MVGDTFIKAAMVAGVAVISMAAQAESLFSLYGGSAPARSGDSGLRRNASGAGLQWRGDARADALHAPGYGLRFTHFPERYPNWGLGLDYRHYNSGSGTAQDAGAKGLWRATLIDEENAADRYAQRFDLAPNVNVLSINGIYRWRAAESAGSRLQPYVGVGLAYYRQGAENSARLVDHGSGVDGAGFGYHLLGGLRYRFTERMGAFVEAKFNRDIGQAGTAGGDAELPLRSFHAVAGMSYSF